MNATIAPAYAEAWEKAKEFHRHACPGLALGCRIAVDALVHLVHTPSEDEELVCVAENESCALDAIQAITGCSMGKGNLILRLRGKYAYSFFVRGRKAAIRLHWNGAVQASSPDDIVAYYLSAPFDELYRVLEPEYALPPKAFVSSSLICDACGEAVAEPYVRLHEGRKVCLDCHISASRIIM